MARAEIHWEDPAGTPNTASAMIEDTSRSGMSIRSPKQISVGSKLEVKWHREHLVGVVRNCRKDGFEYLLGIQRDLP